MEYEDLWTAIKQKWHNQLRQCCLICFDPSLKIDSDKKHVRCLLRLCCSHAVAAVSQFQFESIDTIYFVIVFVLPSTLPHAIFAFSSTLQFRRAFLWYSISSSLPSSFRLPGFFFVSFFAVFNLLVHNAKLIYFSWIKDANAWKLSTKTTTTSESTNFSFVCMRANGFLRVECVRFGACVCWGHSAKSTLNIRRNWKRSSREIFIDYFLGILSHRNDVPFSIRHVCEQNCFSS